MLAGSKIMKKQKRRNCPLPVISSTDSDSELEGKKDRSILVQGSYTVHTNILCCAKHNYTLQLSLLILQHEQVATYT